MATQLKLVEEDKKAVDRQKALEAALAQIDRAFGKGSAMKLGQKETMQVESISTGSLGLDIALGVGGLPKGRVVEVYGPESSGKTTLALHVIAEAQKAGGTAAFVDAEHALDPTYAQKLGCNVDELLISQPDTGEQALEIADTLVRSGALDVLVVDSVAAIAGGASSTSSNTSYIESASGIGEGARTGIASIVTGLLFLVAMFFSPLVTVIPHEAATPALVVVGFLMMTQIRHINFLDYQIGIPAFLTIILMPFTYSITVGIGAGFVTWVVIKLATGRVRDVNWLMWVVSIAFAIYFLIDPIQTVLGVG